MKKIMKLILFLLPIFILCIVILYHRRTNEVKENERKTSLEKPDKKVIRLLRMPYANSLKVAEENYNLLMYLSEKTGFDVKLSVARTYEEAEDIAKNGEADVIWTATNHYVENISAFSDYVPILRPVRHGDDKYRGIIITSNKSDIHRIEDLKGKEIAFTDIDSTSGCILPKALLKNKYNIDIYSFFSDIRYLGSHDSVIENVYYGKVSAGAVFEDAPATILKERKDGIRILEKTDYILNEPIVIKRDIDKSFKKILNDELTDNIPEILKKDLSVEGFVIANQDEYKKLRKVLGYE